MKYWVVGYNRRGRAVGRNGLVSGILRLCDLGLEFLDAGLGVAERWREKENGYCGDFDSDFHVGYFGCVNDGRQGKRGVSRTLISPQAKSGFRLEKLTVLSTLAVLRNGPSPL